MGKRKAAEQSDSIDITGSAQDAGESEVINLADDSPASTSGRGEAGAAEPSVIADSEEQQKRKIMALASMVNHRKRSKPAQGAEAVASASSAPEDNTANGQPGSDEVSAKQAIMQHATQLNASNSLLAQLHAERLARQQLAHPKHHDKAPAQAASKQKLVEDQPISELKLLTYNVWFEEDIEVHERMSTIGDIIMRNGYPHFICFQEVTPAIYHLFQVSHWWQRYCVSAPMNQPYFTALLYNKDVLKPDGPIQIHEFSNSCMGRNVLSITGTVGGHKVTVATSHLESPLGYDMMFSKQRVAQCKEGFAVLNAQRSSADVLWAGDMNWNEAEDGSVPLPVGWIDAWSQQNPTDPGFTYDGKLNPMLGPYNRLRKRLDRVFCKTYKWKLASICMVGTQAIPGVTYKKSYKRGAKALPVLPSDHFGLLACFDNIAQQ